MIVLVRVATTTYHCAPSLPAIHYFFDFFWFYIFNSVRTLSSTDGKERIDEENETLHLPKVSRY